MTNHISYLNQIFYKYKKFEKEDAVQLENWMLTPKWMDRTKLPKYGKTVWIRISKNPQKTESTEKCLKSPDPWKDESKREVLQNLQKTESTEKCLKSPDPWKDESKREVLQNPKKTESTEKRRKEVPRGDPHRFLSKKQDTLFWAIYVAKYGEAEYQQIGNKYKNVEIAEKMKLVQYMSQSKSIIQKTALDLGKKIPSTKMQEIQADFMVNKQTSYFTFWIMCMYYKINAVVFKKHTYMKMYTVADPEADQIHVFFEEKQGYVSLDERQFSRETLEEMFNARIYVDHTTDKIFKSASAYSIEELHDFANKLGITQKITDQYRKPSKNDWMREVLLFMASV